MRTLVMAACICGASIARAEPSKADQTKCKHLIDDGRNLASAGKLAQAIAKLEACVAVIPDQATALSELGFTAYRAKDYVKAEAATRKAIASQGSPNVRGASLYNLGLILEDTKDTAGAIAAYTESLRARPHGVVRARLRKLDAKAADAFDPYKPASMAGPFPTLDAFCKTIPAKEPETVNGIDMPCTCGHAVKSASAVGPFKELEVFTQTCALDGHKAGSMGSDVYRIAARVDAGWFVAPLSTVWFSDRCSNSPKVAVLGAKSLGGRQVGHIEVTNEGECRKEGYWADRTLVVVGSGASGAPSATPPIIVKRHEDRYVPDPDGIVTGDTETVMDVVLDVKWNADGTLEVKGKTMGLDKAAAGDVIGKHALPFP
ncbi:MAG TPA: tetratricopeptide repeat protein [Kofleriaceae bacterium]|jgi:hypothetical protein|nr:tetratricopeptide repeat protein [Kofleriaceae bacterium]